MPHPTIIQPGQKPTAILGAGGHARVLIESLKLMGRTICYAVDDDPKLQGKSVLGATITGVLDALNSVSPDEVELVNGIGSTALPTVRTAVFQRFAGMGFTFATVVHPSAIISDSAMLLPGAQVMAGAVIQCGAVIGQNTIINTRASVDHDCAIDDHTHLAPGTTLSGSVRVGTGSHLGSGTTVIQGIQIGDAVLTGAGAVVIRDIPSGTLAKGVPATWERQP